MTWRIFARTICDSKFINCKQWEIIFFLFQAAGVKEGKKPLEKTIRSWLENRRNCNGKHYFNGNKIDNIKVFQFFRKIPEEKLWGIQNEFKKNIDASSPIDVNTDNLDLFCWSLLNQFLDLLGFLRVDIPDDFSLPGAKSKSIKDVHPYNKCCLYCEKWRGDKSTIGPNRVPTLGTCTIQEKKKFFKYFNLKSTLSSDEICNHYQADQQLLKNLKLMGYSIEE